MLVATPPTIRSSMSGVKTLDGELVQELNSLRASCSCANPLLLIGIAALLVIIPCLQLLLSFRKSRASARQLVTLRFNSPLQFAGVVFNGCLGLVYLGLGLWMVAVDNIHQDASVYQPHWWLVALLQGFSLILTGFTFSVRPCFLGVAFVRFWSVFLIVCAAFIFYSSIVHIDVADKTITMKACFDVLFLLGTLLFIVYGIGHIKEDGYGGTDNDLREPLNIEISSDTDHSDSQVSPFAKAGFFSTMSFLWLNPLMKMGYEKPLEEKDLPLLDPTDRSHNQYLMLLEKLNNKELQRNGTPSIFWTIISCHKSGIMVSGLFALVKVLVLSSGPLLLKAYVNVSLEKGTFTYEAYVLAAALLFCKCCESLSQRQWYFRTRRLGLQVRSFLSAAIYKKHQKLSNTGKMKHSSAEIISYVTVDAYRIGEFPYRFHQTWTASLQLCIALSILYNAVGLAMIASLVVIIITVLCNTPVAKQLSRAYSRVLFWASPVFVSAATFFTCYLLKIPLDATNVFTFVATLSLFLNPSVRVPTPIPMSVSAGRCTVGINEQHVVRIHGRRGHVLPHGDPPSRRRARPLSLSVRPLGIGGAEAPEALERRREGAVEGVVGEVEVEELLQERERRRDGPAEGVGRDGEELQTAEPRERRRARAGEVEPGGRAPERLSQETSRLAAA